MKVLFKTIEIHTISHIIFKIRLTTNSILLLKCFLSGQKKKKKMKKKYKKKRKKKKMKKKKKKKRKKKIIGKNPVETLTKP